MLSLYDSLEKPMTGGKVAKAPKKLYGARLNLPFAARVERAARRSP
jgi:hypothetical protein